MESLFSGLNNIRVFSILDEEFSDKFGFTEDEVKLILKDFQIKTPFPEIRKFCFPRSRKQEKPSVDFAGF
ncbi:MAG: AAA family ATPase [Bacteroidales bacterium]|nr:AAA family ATPase [Bacteroidales bacterium]MCF8454587.1 AAA family ATPase [Bacteroidales bacterium]